MPDIYLADTNSKAVFAADGPKPQFLIDTPQFKVLIVGLEAGGQIPVHADRSAGEPETDSDADGAPGYQDHPERLRPLDRAHGSGG